MSGLEGFYCINGDVQRESHWEAKPARENSCLGFIEAVHQ